MFHARSVASLGDHFSGRRVVVTGGASFIGSHLVERLVGLGASVAVVDDLSSGSLDHLASCRADVDVVIGDLRTPGVADRAFAGASTVLHLAARHGGRAYIDAHPVACATNAALDAIVFTAAADAGVRAVVHASSACVYPLDAADGQGDHGGFREDEAGFGARGRAFADGEYGWAKLYGELQLAAFVREGRFHGAAARLFNAYGARENDSHALVALALRALRQEDPFVVWGDGTQQRAFTHVDDVVTGLCLAATVEGFEVVNVGSADAVSIDELCERIFHEVGWRPREIVHDLTKPVGSPVRRADTSKLRAAFGWAPGIDLAHGLARTIRSLEAGLGADRILSDPTAR